MIIFKDSGTDAKFLYQLEVVVPLHILTATLNFVLGRLSIKYVLGGRISD